MMKYLAAGLWNSASATCQVPSAATQRGHSHILTLIHIFMKKETILDDNPAERATSLYEKVQKKALNSTGDALRSIHSQYELTPVEERGEVSEINQAKKGAELALVSLAIIASGGDEQRIKDLLNDQGFDNLF